MNQDTSKMSSSQLRELAESLFKQAEEQSMKEFESTMNFLSDKLHRMGRTKKDAVLHLLKMMKSTEAEDALAQIQKHSLGRSKERSDLDSQGNAPEVGATYVLPNGQTWHRKSKMGPPKRDFAEHAKSTTWHAMKSL